MKKKSAIEPRKAEEFEFQEIVYEKKDWLARITINRPQVYNAYSTLTLKELIQAFTDASFDDSIGVIVLTGAGERAFSTGGDVEEYASVYTVRPRDYWKYMGLFRGYIEAILNTGKPVIARINGIAVGGGNESQMACDLAVMAEHAYVGQVGTSVGSVACGGATQWLPLIVGDRKAREMLFLCERISAHQALKWGLVNRVAPTVARNGTFIENPSPEEISKALNHQEGYAIDFTRLDSAVLELAEKILNKFPECTRYTKEQVNFWKNLVWSATVGHGRDWLALHFASLEPYEGMKAFVEKRKVDYKGLRAKIAKGGSGEFLWGPYTKECPSCGAKGLPSDFSFCGACGAPLKKRVN